MTNPSEEQLTALATSELSALKEAAEKATQGEWRAQTGVMDIVHIVGVWSATDVATVFLTETGTKRTGRETIFTTKDKPRAKADAAYIALANPATILSLLHSLATVTAENGKLREALERVKAELMIPAAEYVPAIPDCWTIIDNALEGSHDPA